MRRPNTKEYTISALQSDNILNQTIYNPISEMPLGEKFWWEAFGMFFLILLICAMNPLYNFDYWLSALLPVAIMLSVKQSGAHYNPSMSLSNFFIVFSPTKFSPFFMWTYFKAEFFPAFIAFNLVFLMKGYYSDPWIPNNGVQQIRAVISQMVGTFMLVVLLQKISNSLTTFTTSDISTYSFVVVFVYIARRFAASSGNSINPVANLAGVCAAIFHCNFAGLRCFHLFLLGDFLGSCLGVLFYNRILWPAIQISRRQNKQNQNSNRQQQSLSKVIKEINQDRNRKSSLDINKITKIQYHEERQSDQQLQINLPILINQSEYGRQISDIVFLTPKKEEQ